MHCVCRPMIPIYFSFLFADFLTHRHVRRNSMNEFVVDIYWTMTVARCEIRKNVLRFAALSVKCVRLYRDVHKIAILAATWIIRTFTQTYTGSDMRLIS